MTVGNGHEARVRVRNDKRLPKELRGILLDPRAVNTPGQGLSIYEEATPSPPSRFGWLRLLGYAAGAVIVGTAALKKVRGNSRLTRRKGACGER